MPISVTCGSCAASFSVKDEYAGKRAKCPKCAEPLTLPAVASPPAPAAPPVAAPVVARPVAARVPPKPAGEGEPKRRRADEDDTPKRKRGADAEDDKPQRKRGDDDAEEKPHSRRRRRDDDDDDEPKKKSKALPIILGVVGGLLLLCGGGCAGVWVFVVNPAIEQAKAIQSRLKTSQGQSPPPPVQAEPQRPIEEPPVADLKAIELAQLQKADRQKYDKKWVRITGPVPRVNIESQPGKADWGQLHVGVPPGAVVVCHFDATEWATRGVIDDEFVYSVVGLYDDNVFGVSMKHCRVVGQAVAEPSTPVAFADLVNSPAQYTGKMVEVSGLVKSAVPLGGGTSVLLIDGPADKTVRFTIPSKGKDFPPNAGDRLTVKAKVGRAGGGTVDLDFRKLVSRLPGDGKPPAPPPPSALTVADVIKDAAAFKGQNVAVRGKVKLVIEHADGSQGTVVFEEGDGKHTLHAVFPPGKWRKDFIRGGEDTIDVRGTLSGSMGNPGTGLHYDVLECDLVRRTAKDGKDVPLPPVPPPVVAVKVKAEDLAGEFAADLDRAKKKYTDKTVSVSGVVEKLTPTGSKVTLTGVPADGTNKAFVVEATMSFDKREEVKKLKVGDTVTLTAKYGGFRPFVTTVLPNGVMLTGGEIQK